MIVISLQEATSRLHERAEERARVAFIEQEFERALPSARLAVRCRPQHGPSRILLGDVLCALDRNAEALLAYHRARRRMPDRAEPFWSISTVHALARRWSDSLRYLDRALPLLKRGDGPLYEWIAEDRALALWRLGRHDEALDTIRWGLRRRPRGKRLRTLDKRIRAARSRGLHLVDGGRLDRAAPEAHRP